jgi:hypothetical protein
VVGGYFDTALHGWRAHARAQEAAVAWNAGVASVLLGAASAG